MLDQMRNMWTYAIKQKLTAAVLLFTVIALVMVTNMRLQHTATRISVAVTSIYEDRLVVAEYILRLSKKMEDIIKILDRESNGNGVNRSVADLLSDVTVLNALYEKTTLTETERTNFETFKQLCRVISANIHSNDHASALVAARDSIETLQTLSLIQVEEGKNQLDEVLDMTYFSNILSYLELVILIVIAVIIQALVFASKTMMGAQRSSNQNLN